MSMSISFCQMPCPTPAHLRPTTRNKIAGLDLVLDDIETHLLDRELDTSGDFQ